MTSRQKALNELSGAFQNYDKWKTYGIAFTLMDKRKVRLIDIKDAAYQIGISPDIIEMRRHFYVKNKGLAA
tara:strand:- start:164 stop:376 length:213 start_codon:yes stop_codon:yes gene_type:complete